MINDVKDTTALLSRKRLCLWRFPLGCYEIWGLDHRECPAGIWGCVRLTPKVSVMLSPKDERPFLNKNKSLIKLPALESSLAFHLVPVHLFGGQYVCAVKLWSMPEILHVSVVAELQN